MTSCQTPNDPAASDNPPENLPAPDAESASSAGTSTPATASSSSRSTGGMKARVNARLAAVLEDLGGGDFKLPLDENWYIRWAGNNYDLVRIKQPEEGNDLTKVRHQVEAHCGRNLGYALRVYGEKATAESGIQSAKGLLVVLAKLQATIDAIAKRIDA